MPAESILLEVEELDTVRVRGENGEKKDNDGNDKTSDFI
jgi:hypothetical protein